MSHIEDLRLNVAGLVILPECLVAVVGTRSDGWGALELICETPAGRVANERSCVAERLAWAEAQR